MKKCCKCKEIKEASEFALNKLKKDGLQTYCKECKKKYDAVYFKKNKDAQLERNKANRRKYRKILSEIKESAGCCICGENDPCCLDFHHIDDKHENVSNMIYAINKALEEVEKCKVVCANCHRKIHAGRIEIQ